jgi:hypothetical protein
MAVLSYRYDSHNCAAASAIAINGKDRFVTPRARAKAMVMPLTGRYGRGGQS